MAPVIDSKGRTFIKHPSGQTTHYVLDDFTDPWKPSEAIILQPGFGRHASFWYHWVPILARKYRVIRRDLRGHGFSSVPSSNAYEYSLDTILAEIIDTLDQLGLEKVHFLGESTSGMLAEALAARHPSRLLSITVCSSPTFLPLAAQHMFALGEESWPVACRKLGARGWAERLSQVPGTVSSPDPGYIKWWLEQISLQSGEGLAGYAEFLSTLDGRPFLKDIKVPMLILAPANSAATKVEEQRGIQEQVSGARLVVIEGKGHEIVSLRSPACDAKLTIQYTEMAEECQTAFLEFLLEVESQRTQTV